MTTNAVIKKTFIIKRFKFFSINKDYSAKHASILVSAVRGFPYFKINCSLFCKKASDEVD